MRSDFANVYLYEKLAGFLERSKRGAISFFYDEAYLRSKNPQAISYTLPLTEDIYVSESGLNSFFDNLVSEGWLADLQARQLKIDASDRFTMLANFGRDCVGAVSVIDPKTPYPLLDIASDDIQVKAALSSAFSLSGVQAKIFVKKQAKKYYPIDTEEPSTHIAKFASKTYPDLLDNEYLTTMLSKILLKNDSVAEMEIANIEGLNQKALIVKRFDRDDQGKKIHFEEFNQLMSMKTTEKYDASYSDMAKFMYKSELCKKTDIEKLFRRILVCILLGNGDAHLKNFAMFHKDNSLSLCPIYDMVSTLVYPGLNDLALNLHKDKAIRIREIKAKDIILLTRDFNLSDETLRLALEDFSKRLDHAIDKLATMTEYNSDIRSKLTKELQARWNGTMKPALTMIGKN